MSRARKNVGGASVPLFRIFDGEQATRDALPQESALFRRNDGSAAFEMGQFQKQNALGQGSEAAFPICWDLGAGAVAVFNSKPL